MQQRQNETLRRSRVSNQAKNGHEKSREASNCVRLAGNFETL